MLPDFLGVDPFVDITVTRLILSFLFWAKISNTSLFNSQELFTLIFSFFAANLPILFTLINSASIDIAISSGVTAPILSPIGEYIFSIFSYRGQLPRPRPEGHRGRRVQPCGPGFLCVPRPEGQPRERPV